MRALVLVVICTVACAQQGNATPSREQCQRLRSHVVELRLAGVSVAGTDSHRDALTRALGDEFVDKCQQLSMREVTCALAAKDSVSVTACSTSR